MWRLALLPNAYNNAAARGRFAEKWAMPGILGKRRAIGYGGTSRKRARSMPMRRSRVYRARRSTRRSYGKRRTFRRKGARAIPRPLKWGSQQPAQVFVKHTLIHRHSVTHVAGTHQLLAASIKPLQGNDIFIDELSGTRVFPNLWVNFADKYRSVRVHGISIKVHFSELSANANEGFVSTFYTAAGPKAGTSPSDPYDVNTQIKVSQFHQEKGLRKKLLLGPYTNGSTNKPVHNAGYFNVKRIQSDESLDTHIAELEVNTNGSAADSPDLSPIIFHKHIPVAFGGLGTETLTETYRITLYCTWFNRRRVFEPTFTV